MIAQAVQTWLLRRSYEGELYVIGAVAHLIEVALVRALMRRGRMGAVHGMTLSVREVAIERARAVVCQTQHVTDRAECWAIVMEALRHASLKHYGNAPEEFRTCRLADEIVGVLSTQEGES